MRAAILQAPGDEGLGVHDGVETVPVREGFVRVRVTAAGVCHSDLSAISGRLGLPTPVVIGHEAAGEVLEAGPGVSAFSTGDRVILSWVPQCGECGQCRAGRPQLCGFNTTERYRFPRFNWRGRDVWAQAGCGVFAEEVMVSEHNLVPLPDDVPDAIGAIVGCGVSTGFGAVVNTAGVVPGSAVAVIGCGGVGLSAVQAAASAGASVIAAIDPVAGKHEIARQLGATHAATPEQVPELLREATGGDGFDYAIEAVGAVPTIRMAYDAIRRGGTAVIAGVGPKDAQVPFTPYELYADEKRLVGSVFGSTDIRRDFARVIDHWRAGTLDLDSIISATIGLDDLPEAIAALRRGSVLRNVVTFD